MRSLARRMIKGLKPDSNSGHMVSVRERGTVCVAVEHMSYILN